MTARRVRSCASPPRSLSLLGSGLRTRLSACHGRNLVLLRIVEEPAMCLNPATQARRPFISSQAAKTSLFDDTGIELASIPSRRSLQTKYLINNPTLAFIICQFASKFGRSIANRVLTRRCRNGRQPCAPAGSEASQAHLWKVPR